MLIASNLIAMDEADTIPTQEMTTEHMCNICYEPASTPALQQISRVYLDQSYGCKQGNNLHYFHQKCLDKWLTGADETHSQCPQCKAKIYNDLIYKDFFNAIRTANIATLAKFLNPKIIDSQDKDGTSALHYAVFCKNIKIIEILLLCNANIDIQNSDGLTALHLATWYKNKPIVEFLLTQGANPDIQDNDGHTPLHYATFLKLIEIVEILLAQGANPDI